MSRSKANRDKRNKAVALKYNMEEDPSPIVIASGYGEIAEKQGIPVFRDDSAVSLLCMLEIGSNIPEELYQVVAAIYVQLLATSKKIKNTSPGSSAMKVLGASLFGGED